MKRRPRNRQPGLFSPIKPIRNIELGRALLAIVIAPCLVYAGVTVRTAHEMRKTYVLDRNLIAARLSARLLDEKCDTALSVLNFMSRRYDLQYSLDARDLSAVASDINNMVDSVPDHALAYVAVYTKAGTLFARNANTFAAQPDARK